MKRKSPIQHKVHTYKKENGKTVQSFLRGKGARQTHLANPTIQHLPNLKIHMNREIKDYYPSLGRNEVKEKPWHIVQNLLKKIPNKYIKGLTIEWYDSLNPYNTYYGKGPYGKYDEKDDRVLLRNTNSLPERVPVHEIGHRVFDKFLTKKQQDEWNATSAKLPEGYNGPYGKDEVFVELFTEQILGKKTLLHLEYQPEDVQKTFKKIWEELS